MIALDVDGINIDVAETYPTVASSKLVDQVNNVSAGVAVVVVVIGEVSADI